MSTFFCVEGEFRAKTWGPIGTEAQRLEISSPAIGMICPVCGIYLRAGDMAVGVPVAPATQSDAAAQARGGEFIAICELAHAVCVGRKGDNNMGIVIDEPSIPPVRTIPSREPPAPTMTHAVMVIGPDGQDQYSKHTNQDEAMTVALDLDKSGKYIYPDTVWVAPLMDDMD